WDRAVLANAGDVPTILEAGAFHEAVDSSEAALRFYSSALERVRPDDRARIVERTKALKLQLAKARNDEFVRRLQVCKAELEFVKALPMGGDRKSRADALSKRIEELEAYQKETKKLIESP
ncbi:MAG: hypothetical protein ACAI25_01470, partial [Planctomycetota bacterium]